MIIKIIELLGIGSIRQAITQLVYLVTFFGCVVGGINKNE